MQDEFPMMVDNCVTGIIASGEADHHLRLFRQEVNDFPLSLITPLSANHRNNRH